MRYLMVLNFLERNKRQTEQGTNNLVFKLIHRNPALSEIRKESSYNEFIKIIKLNGEPNPDAYNFSHLKTVIIVFMKYICRHKLSSPQIH